MWILQGRNVRLQTECKRIFRTLRHDPNSVNVREFTSQHQSGTQWKLVLLARPFWTWMMVLEISHQYAENARSLGQTQDPEYLEKFLEEQ